MKENHTPRSQQFTFIDVRAKKDANQRRIKSHVSYDTNRKKRRAAVAKFQSSLLGVSAEASLITTGGATRASQSSTLNDSVQDQLDLNQHSLESASTLTKSSCKIQDEDDNDLSENEQQDSWTLYVSLLRNGVSSPWQTLHKKTKPLAAAAAGLRGSRVQLPLPLKSSLGNRHLPFPIHIVPPSFMKETEEALVCLKNFMESQYHHSWKHELGENPYIYEHDYELALFRDCLYIAFDELSRGIGETAFTILNNCLDAATRLIKKQQPILIFTLLDVAMDVRNVQDARLNKMLKDYIVGLAAAILGTQHPLVILLKHSTSREQKDYLLSTLFQSLLDVDSGLFGPNNFQTTGVRFAIMTHKIAEGTSEALQQASAHFDIVSKQWHQSYPTESLMCDLIDIEGTKIAHGKGAASAKDVSMAVDRVLKDYEQLASIAGHQATTSGKDCMYDQELMTKLNALGREWLAKSYHGMALYSYTHLQDISQSSGKVSGQSLCVGDVTRDHFAAKTVRLLVHGSDE